VLLANLPRLTVTDACNWGVVRFVIFFVWKMYFCLGFLMCRVSSEVCEEDETVLNWFLLRETLKFKKKRLLFHPLIY